MRYCCWWLFVSIQVRPPFRCLRPILHSLSHWQFLWLGSSKMKFLLLQGGGNEVHIWATASWTFMGQSITHTQISGAYARGLGESERADDQRWTIARPLAQVKRWSISITYRSGLPLKELRETKIAGIRRRYLIVQINFTFPLLCTSSLVSIVLTNLISF